MNNVSQKTAIVWTKSENREGTKAANLLRRMGAKVEVREIDSDKWKKSDVAAAVPGYTTLPQIVFDGEVIGNFAAVLAHPNIGGKIKKTHLNKEERTAKSIENKANWTNNKKAAAAERSVASNLVVKGRKNHPTEEQKAAALTRAVAAKADRAAHAEASLARITAARG